MIICERCSTENLDGSRYCDECGAALWLAGRARTISPNGEQSKRNNGSVVKPVTENLAVPGSTRVPERSGIPAPKPLTSSAAVKPHAKLVIERGRSAGKQFVLSNEDSQIGRWDADGGVFPDVDLDDDDPEAKVSRRHARIMRDADEYFIEDLGSTNGTFVNRGRRLIPGSRQLLRDGDEIIVGKTFLRFHVTR
jgi:hypothetical protein